MTGSFLCSHCQNVEAKILVSQLMMQNLQEEEAKILGP